MSYNYTIYTSVKHIKILLKWNLGKTSSTFTVLSGPRVAGIRHFDGVTGDVFLLTWCSGKLLISSVLFPELPINAPILYLWGKYPDTVSAPAANDDIFGFISIVTFAVNTYNKLICAGLAK